MITDVEVQKLRNSSNDFSAENQSKFPKEQLTITKEKIEDFVEFRPIESTSSSSSISGEKRTFGRTLNSVFMPRRETPNTLMVVERSTLEQYLEHNGRLESRSKILNVQKEKWSLNPTSIPPKISIKENEKEKRMELPLQDSKSKRNSRSISDHSFLSSMTTFDKKEKEKNVDINSRQIIAKTESIERIQKKIPKLTFENRSDSLPSLRTLDNSSPNSSRNFIKKLFSPKGEGKNENPSTLQLKSYIKDLKEINEDKIISHIKDEMRLTIINCYCQKGGVFTNSKLDKSTCVDILGAAKDVQVHIVRIIIEYIWDYYDNHPEVLNNSNGSDVIESLVNESFLILDRIRSSKGLVRTIIPIYKAMQINLVETTKSISSKWINNFSEILTLLVEGSSQLGNNYLSSFLQILNETKKDGNLSEILNFALPTNEKNWKEVKTQLEIWNNPEFDKKNLQEIEEIIPRIVLEIHRHFKWSNDNLSHITKEQKVFRWDEEEYLKSSLNNKPIYNLHPKNILRCTPSGTWTKVDFKEVHIVCKSLSGNNYYTSIEKVKLGDFFGTLYERRESFFQGFIQTIYRANFDLHVDQKDIDKMVKIILTLEEKDRYLESTYERFIKNWLPFFLDDASLINKEKYFKTIQSIAKALDLVNDEMPLEPLEAIYLLMIRHCSKNSRNQADTEIFLDLLIKRFNVYINLKKLEPHEKVYSDFLLELDIRCEGSDLRSVLIPIYEKLEKGDISSYECLNNKNIENSDPIVILLKTYSKNYSQEAFKKIYHLIALRIYLDLMPESVEKAFLNILEEISNVTKNTEESFHLVIQLVSKVNKSRFLSTYPSLEEAQNKLPCIIHILLRSNLENFSNNELKSFAYRLTLTDLISNEILFIEKYKRLINLLLETTFGCLSFAEKNIIRKSLHELYTEPLAVKNSVPIYLKITIFPHGKKTNYAKGNFTPSSISTSNSISPRSEISVQEKKSIFLSQNKFFYKVSQRIMLIVYPVLNPVARNINKPLLLDYPLISIPCDFTLWLEKGILHSGRVKIRKDLYHETIDDGTQLKIKQVGSLSWFHACIGFQYRNENESNKPTEIEYTNINWSTLIYRALESPYNPSTSPPLNLYDEIPRAGSLTQRYIEMMPESSRRTSLKKPH